ncbi:MAG: NfeD family protein [Lachnospiraceae bacterium]|nr:NfeD family protein [Lachnospiraceae bacterium]
MDKLVIFWFAAFAVFLVIELATFGLATIWFAAGALCAGIVALITDNLAIQIVVFAVVSALLLIFTKPLVTKYINGKRVKTNVESIIGQYARVTSTIDNFNEKGEVSILGNVWMARALNNEVIEEGTKVVIKSVQGVKLIVVKADETGIEADK